MTAKKILLMFGLVLLIFGCAPKPPVTEQDKLFLTVNYEQARTLRYKFVSTRQIETLFEQSEKDGSISNYSESLETVVTYKPIKVNPYGLSEIEATIETVKAVSDAAPKDAVQNLAGKSFKLLVGPTGMIEDRKELEEILRQAAKTTFRPTGEAGKIKEPDLLGDFLAAQFFLWDSISSIKEVRKGVVAGQSWQSQLSIPSTMMELFGAARDVEYQLQAIKDSNDGKIAVIAARYSLSKTPLQNLFFPYQLPNQESFMQAGPFGLFANYRILELDGKGTELFNIDKGKTISSSQDYKMRISASLALIPVKITITVNQHLSMQLIN